MFKKSPINLFIPLALLLAGVVFLQSCTKKHTDLPQPESKSLAITSFSPATGAKGTTVIIMGTGFSASAAENVVTFNGKAANVLTATPNQLTVLVPTGADNGKISIRTAGLTAQSATDFKYRFTVSTLAGDGTRAFADGNGPSAHFNYPFGVATDAAGNIYVADFGNDRVRKMNAAGAVQSLAGRLRGFSNGQGTAASFHYPGGMAVDTAGNIFVADTRNNLIRKVSPGGLATTFAGDRSAGFANGQGVAAKFSTPHGVAMDSKGNIYVADAENNRIRKITPGGLVSTFAGNGKRGFVNGPATVAQFSSPMGVAADVHGNIYVADSRNNMIRKITPAGFVSTLAGNVTSGFNDGAEGTARFFKPSGVTVDLDGDVYVADAHNHSIRVIAPNGTVNTIAGSSDFGFADGIGTAARFYYPTGIAIDASGNIYVADSANNRIRLLQ